MGTDERRPTGGAAPSPAPGAAVAGTPRGGAAEVAVIIVNYRTPDLAMAALRSVADARADGVAATAVMVDGGSGDDSAARLAAAMAAPDYAGWARLLPLALNGGFGWANNQAILTLAAEGALPPAVMLLNPDARCQPGAIRALLDRMTTDDRIGAVGARLENEDGEAQGSAFYFPDALGEFLNASRTMLLRRLARRPLPHILSAEARAVPWVTGAAVLLRSAALQEAGLFDDGFFLYFEETELMHRLRRYRWTIWYEPEARVFHYARQSTGIYSSETGELLRTRVPQYWYDSVRRYFVRTSGRAGAWASMAAWLTGHAVWELRRILTGQARQGPEHEFSDRLRFSTAPRARDLQPRSPPHLVDGPGRPPAWQSGGERA